ncbi:MAG TPA: efflux RND transporter periplasmic adaptor subunit [Candidatus Limnocylindria bacterium]|nr:efflux RND transporter periplasmic adaptor subunit [Candidatus Limnocylindria bacterium]
MKLNLEGMKIGLITVAITLAVSLAGCKKGAAQHGAGVHGQMPPPVVTVSPVQQHEIVEWNEFTGRTAAIENVEVRPRVSGHIEAVKFQSGQLVKKGDVLFQIDARWYQAEFNRRAAEYESTKVRLLNAEREAKRTTQLLANNAISSEEGDQRQARFEEARAMMLAAEAARDSAKLDLDYTTIRSPIDGRVSRAWVTEGNYINVAAGNGSVLTTVVSVDPVHVYADVDENTLLKFNALLRAGKLASLDGKVPVELQLADEEGFPHKGYVESFDNKLDPQAGSILLRSVFANAEGKIVPGLFARIRLPASDKHPAVMIEETAIGTDQAQKFVLTVTSSNTVEYRPVKLGPQVSGKRLVREGLQAGEQVVQNIVMARVRPCMPVQPQAGTNDSVTPVQTAQR